MTIDQLIYFTEVYRLKSINAASLNLHISQQSLSTSIKHLENEFSTSFFTRTQKGVVATESGKKFYQSAQIILSELTSFRYNLNSIDISMRYKIGVLSSFSAVISTPLFQLLSEKFPNVFFDFVDFPFSNLFTVPINNCPDIIFTFIFKDQVEHLQELLSDNNYVFKYVSNARGTLHLWISVDSPLARYKVLTPKQLQNISLCFPKYQCIPEASLSYFNRVNVHLNDIYFAQSNDIFIDLIRKGFYMTPDFCFNGRSLIHQNLQYDDHILLKPLSDDFDAVYFILIFKKECEQFYPLIADYLNDTPLAKSISI